MKTISTILIAIVALEHLYILWFEMFAWETKGKKALKGAMPADLFTHTKVLAANQGLYNGFLAAGLIWTFFISNPIWQENIAIFFLTCIIIAGCYGAITASKRIFFLQALPSVIALFLIVMQ